MNDHVELNNSFYRFKCKFDEFNYIDLIKCIYIQPTIYAAVKLGILKLLLKSREYKN